MSKRDNSQFEHGPHAPTSPHVAAGTQGARAAAMSHQASGQVAGDSNISPADAAGTNLPEAGLVDEARRQIQVLSNEIAELARSDAEPLAFYEGFLQRVLTALGAQSGALWCRARDGWQPVYQVNLAGAGLAVKGDDERSELNRRSHERLLDKAYMSRRPTMAQPHSGDADSIRGGNPSENLLLVVPLFCSDEDRADADDRDCHVVEIFQRPGGSVIAQRGYLQFLTQVSRYVELYSTSHRLRCFKGEREDSQQSDHFIRSVHQQLNSRRTAYVIANEGRRLIDCDRASVAIRKGGRFRIRAVSGLDSVEPRSDTVRHLEQLAKVVAATGEPLLYPDPDQTLPPQIETACCEHVDHSDAKALAVFPLASDSEEAQTDALKTSNRKKVEGVLIIERFSGLDWRRDTGGLSRARTVVEHGGDALANSLQYDGAFLLPLQRTISGFFQLEKLIAATILAGVFLGLLAAMIVVPGQMEITADGTLEPQVRQEIFAGVGGRVEDVKVRHNQFVTQGQELACLRNTDLEAARTELIGRQTATQKRIDATQRALLGSRHGVVKSQEELDGQLLELRETATSIAQQLELHREKQQQAVVRSHIDGQIVTWRVKDNLHKRVVRQGELLMTVVDPKKAWELQLRVPEKQMGHIAKASEQQNGTPLEVTFMLATHPGDEFQGQVIDIHTTADEYGTEGNTVLVRVAVNKDELPDLRPGASVSASIQCGYHPLGYVWFREAIDWIRAKLWI